MACAAHHFAWSWTLCRYLKIPMSRTARNSFRKAGSAAFSRMIKFYSCFNAPVTNALQSATSLALELLLITSLQAELLAMEM